MKLTTIQFAKILSIAQAFTKTFIRTFSTVFRNTKKCFKIDLLSWSKLLSFKGKNTLETLKIKKAM